MCRLVLQLLGMLGNVLGMLCNVLGMLATSSIEVWWYTTPLTSRLIRQQVGGFLFNMGLLGHC